MSDELEDQVTCEFSRGSYPARVTVDLQEKSVHFQNCHTPEKPLATAEAEFSCELVDILDIHEYSYPGSETLTIVTSTGTAVVPVGATGFDEMKELLTSVAKITPAGRAVNSPVMIWVYGLGALLGLAGPLIWILSDLDNRIHMGLLALLSIFTAFCGVVLIRLIVSLFDRLWEIDLSWSLGLLMGGFIAGLGDGRRVNWWFTGICCLVGFLLGIPAMRKKSRNR
ncbi:MAG: hypothetical protein VYB09_06785 [Planctomycetota bacterium]|nr:hypothetical protein [Planctomycetota bacterium]MEE2989422.1 hypothetical protein [Planctomycetota bacterium]